MFSKPLSDLVHQYNPPKGQISLLFNVPMDRLTEVKKVLQEHFKDSKDTYNIRWRGPRHSDSQQSTLKKDAKTFSVYAVQRREKYTVQITPTLTPPKYVYVNGYQYKRI